MNVATVVRKSFAALLCVVLNALAVNVSGDRGLNLAAAESPTAEVPASADARIALPDFSAMVQKNGPAVVNIRVVTLQSSSSPEDEEPSGNDPFGPNGPFGPNSPYGPDSPFAPFLRGFPNFPPARPAPTPIRGEGSGFILRPDGLILTNAHVVSGASEVTVHLTDRREYTAKIIGIDHSSEIAVIKINATGLPIVKFGDPKALKVGEWVLAIGAPFGFENSATQGIVSAKGRILPESGYVAFIQTDVPINPRNSGGPLFNMQGEVVGINSQIYSQTGGYMGVSFAIPIDFALNVARQLETTGHVTRGRLGVVIQSVSQALADSFGLPEPEGALVSRVEKRSPAQEAGIRAGDVILDLDGEPVRDSSELPVRIASLSPGTTITLEVWRNHTVRKVPVTLGAMQDGRTAEGDGGIGHADKLGLSVRPLTEEEKRSAETSSGVLVEHATGPAAMAGIRTGDVVLSANGVPVSSHEELNKALERSKGRVALLVQRGDIRIFIALNVG